MALEDSHFLFNMIVPPGSFVLCRLASASHSSRRSNRVLPDGSGYSSMKCSKLGQSRLHHHILHSIETPPPCMAVEFQIFGGLPAPCLRILHMQNEGMMCCRPSPRFARPSVFIPDNFVQINPWSSAFDICTSSAAPKTDPSPSGSARTPGCRKARSTHSGHVKAHARLHSAARWR